MPDQTPTVDGSWSVWSEWAPIEATPSEVTQHFNSEGDAVSAGRRIACAHGARRLEVRDPLGETVCTWTRTDSIWRGLRS